MEDRDINMMDAAPDVTAGKRKADDVPPAQNKQAKKERARGALVTLRNTRLALQQRAVHWDRTMPVLRGMLQLQSYLAEHAGEQLSEVPKEHLPVIASLVQESDKNAVDLAKVIKGTLLPEGHAAAAQDGDKPNEVLSLAMIQTAIHAVADRCNYGIDAPSDDAPIPNTLQLWRWEVRDVSLLPAENRGKLLSRRDERKRAKEQAAKLFGQLPSDAQQALLSGKKRHSKSAEPNGIHAEEPAPPAELSSPAPALSGPESSPAPPSVSLGPQSSPTGATRTPDQKASSTPSHEKSERTKQRESRRAERQAKDLKQEKDKQAQIKLFSSFFQQPTTRKEEVKAPKSDFELTFLPCQYKNMAPTNPFYRPIGDELLGSMAAQNRPREELLSEFVGYFGRKRAAKRRPTRGIHPPVCVRNVVKAVTESDVLGGNAEERAKQGLERLNNRRLVPLKLLQFQSDRRPGWYGTWTRSTNLISARKPFGQDPIALDYNYDSEAEWDEDGEGENVDGLDEEKEDEESAVSSESDSEMDDWLEDDLEEDVDDEEPVPSAASNTSAAHSALVSDSSSKATEHVNALKPKKKVKLLGRRFDSKLVPYINGPNWEDALYEPNDALRPYTIQFLHDAHTGMNPFTFVTTTVAMESNAEEKNAQSAQPNAQQEQSAQLAQPQQGSSPPPAPSRPTKSSFPDTHLPQLLSMVQGSTRSKPALIEDLWEHFGPIIKNVSKASIESRLQECAMRESKKPGAKWVIKDDYKGRVAGEVAT